MEKSHKRAERDLHRSSRGKGVVGGRLSESRKVGSRGGNCRGQREAKVASASFAKVLCGAKGCRYRLSSRRKDGM